MENKTMTENEFLTKGLLNGHNKEDLLLCIEESKQQEKLAKQNGEPYLPLESALALSYEIVYKHKPYIVESYPLMPPVEEVTA